METYNGENYLAKFSKFDLIGVCWCRELKRLVALIYVSLEPEAVFVFPVFSAENLTKKRKMRDVC